MYTWKLVRIWCKTCNTLQKEHTCSQKRWRHEGWFLAVRMKLARICWFAHSWANNPDLARSLALKFSAGFLSRNAPTTLPRVNRAALAILSVLFQWLKYVGIATKSFRRLRYSYHIFHYSSGPAALESLPRVKQKPKVKVGNNSLGLQKEKWKKGKARRRK